MTGDQELDPRDLAKDLAAAADERTTTQCRCAGCWCTWWRSTPATTATPTFCVSGSMARWASSDADGRSYGASTLSALGGAGTSFSIDGNIGSAGGPWPGAEGVHTAPS
jgi:hypothetical protein